MMKHPSNVERVAAIFIETEAARLEREGRRLQKEWFDDPDSIEKKNRFAHVLLAWGKETRRKGAVEHANKLLSE